MKRIFVAIDISEAARRQVSAYIESLRGEFRSVRVGWEKPEKLHLTLKFLGDADEKQLSQLAGIVGEISAGTASFTLQINETGVFPSVRNPRVLWIDVKDAARNLMKINERLEKECERLGFAREKRAFVPHLTIGRIREPNNARALAQKHLEKGFGAVEFEVSEIVIYESKVQPAGSIYTEVSSHNLDFVRET